MDINADGHLDVLSGSYAGDGQPMQGIFQVLWGQKGNSLAASQPLKGDDGKPLAVTPFRSNDGDLDRICTRPFAADLNGDGHLDIVTGNFGGTFFWFRGQGKGVFSAKSEVIKASDGKPLHVPHHSDPTLVDWDGDGDLDLISGSDGGGVFLARNTGSAKKPVFAPAETLVAANNTDRARGKTHLGLSAVDTPQASTRVAVADLNGDGRLDLVVGDYLQAVQKRKKVAQAEFDRVCAERRALLGAEVKDRDALIENRKKLRKVSRQGGAGLVWVYYRKK